ncbi:MAG: hypothetical protein M9894_20605 [Planctomycetes bacterium]|nr:hypothetical protein [Planctomycetota bacterium]
MDRRRITVISIVGLLLAGPGRAAAQEPSGASGASGASSASSAVDPLAPPAGDPGAPSASPPPEEPAPPPPDVDAYGLPRTVLGGTGVGQAYDDLVALKDAHLPIQLSAWHWVHLNNRGPLASDYGIPGLRGTYFYQVLVYPELETTSALFPRVGAHVNFRFRDDKDQFRAFFESNYWLWEAYGWMETPVGRFKAGKVWKRFGIDWDGTFWGNVQYLDGDKLDPDWGVSLESHWQLTSSVSLDTFAQYFFREDRVNGSLVGGDAESARRSRERDTGVGRAVVTWTTAADLQLALGLSGVLGRVENRRTPGAGAGAEDWLPGAFAVDLTVRWGQTELYLEFLHGWGRTTPIRYLSGGASNRRASALATLAHRLGPVRLHVSFSAGWDDNPSARQTLAVAGGIISLTRNIDVYAEYVHWEVHGAEGDSFATFENGFQLALHWRF